jgi:sugar phosphate isomerase/epimerase
MEFIASIGLNAVDLTGHFFRSYPEIPQNSDLFRLKRRALELGLNISWTDVRNDFVNPDPDLRKADRDLIRKWLTVLSKLGATII